MISKPLLKQSFKANGLAWALVTFASAFMLGILIIVLGNLQASEIRNSLKDTFIESEIETLIKTGAIEGYEETFNIIADIYPETKNIYTFTDFAIKVYDKMAELGLPNPKNVTLEAILHETKIPEDQREQAAQIADIVLTEYEKERIPEENILAFKSEMVIKIILMNIEEEMTENDQKAIITLSEQILSLYHEKNEELLEEDFHTIAILFIEESFYQTLINTENEELKEQLHGLGYDSMKSMLDDYSFDDVRIKTLVTSSFSHYFSLLEHDITKEEAKEEVTKSLLSQMPEQVRDSLVELGDLDINHLVIGTVFYKISGILLPIVYTIMTANNLIAGQVDSGSMAYVLSTPTKRKKVTMTQMVYLVGSLIAMFIVIGGVGFLAKLFIDDSFTITNQQFLLLNIGGLVTMLAISGICFLASATFNRTKHSMGLGGGISMFFLVATILGMFGSTSIPAAMRIESMNLFNYMTIISFFDVTAILEGGTYISGFLILIAIAIVTYAIGIIIFDRKDLPL